MKCRQQLCKLLECSDVFMDFLARMLLLPPSVVESGGQLVPPDGDQERDLPGCSGHRMKNKLSIQGLIIFFIDISVADNSVNWVFRVLPHQKTILGAHWCLFLSYSVKTDNYYGDPTNGSDHRRQVFVTR